MPEQQLIGTNLSEDLITLLCHNDEHGKLVAGMVEPALFPGEYAMIAERAIAYWREYKEAPKQHTANLLAPELEAGGRRSEHLRRTLINMDQTHADTNAVFVLNQVTKFVRMQRLSDATLRAAQLISNHGDPAEIEQLFDAVLRARVMRFDAGIRLDDDLEPFLDHLDTQRGEFVTGIVELDKVGVVPGRGEVLLFIAGKGRGKTWFLVNVGCENLLKQPSKRVLHLSLEMSEMEMRQRYYQRLFAAPKHNFTEVRVPFLERSCSVCRQTANHCHCNPAVKRLSVTKMYPVKSKPEFNFKSRELRTELETRLSMLGARASNLLIKRFPNRSLTVDGFAAYLDYLADGPEHFVPDLVCLDYARLIKQNARTAQDWRISIGQNMEQLRALAIERNFAMVTADQLSRAGHAKRTAHSVHVGEDWTQVHTADTTLTHSATDAEQKLGFVRIFVDHARSEQDKFEVVIAQSLAIGQFCLDSARKPSNYDQLLPVEAQADEADEDRDDEDADMYSEEPSEE